MDGTNDCNWTENVVIGKLTQIGMGIVAISILCGAVYVLFTKERKGAVLKPINR